MALLGISTVVNHCLLRWELFEN